MSVKKLDKKIKERIKQIHWSIYLANRWLTEFYTLTYKSYKEEELKIVNSPTFRFYKGSLQYCFVMEYCKLMEKTKSRNKNIVSMGRLNELMFSRFGKDYKEYEKSKAAIKGLQESDFRNNIRFLRNKKFGHADADEINYPYELIVLKEDEINRGFYQLKEIKTILRGFTIMYNHEYIDLQIPYRDNRTENFIKQQASYKDYYFRNFLKRNKS